ncbi:MAG: efflux RND transporter permease subunit, partial [Thermoguttaceae bacterium]
TQGVDYKIVYDTTPFINESINEVFMTLRDAVLLVAFVVLLFLQNWRSAIIPLIAVPVAIIGTFAAMAAIGFSLNNLTLFGLVLAIGIVVDDAIVVVEAVQRQIDDGLPPREAALKAMNLVSGPVIAVGLVLTAVFVPCAFITGITGQFFRQFALTIAVSTLISAFNSLTLSPALAAILLRRRGEDEYEEVLPPVVFPVLGGWLGYEYLAPLAARAIAGRLPLTSSWTVPVSVTVATALGAWIFHRPLNRILAWLFQRFNVGFDHATNVYTRSVGGLLRVSWLVLIVYSGLLALTWWGFVKSPAGFIPAQDKGYLLVNVQLPDAASVERTERVMHRIEELAHNTPGVKDTVAIAGQSILLGANAPNFGAMYVMLDDFHDRVARGLSGETIAARLQADFRQEVKDGLVNVLGAPPIDGLGTAGGFKIIVEDRGDNGLPVLQHVGEQIVGDAERIPSLASLFSSFRADTPWLFLDIDRTQAKVQGVSMAEIFSALQVYLGSLYVNDFNRNGRTWQVNVQADAVYRRQADDLKQLKVRNDSGGMVPLATVAKPRWISGPVMIQRYNMYIAAPVNGAPAPGVSSGEAIRQMEEAAQRQLRQVHAMNYDWTELAKLQLETGNTAMYVFVLAVVLVFLVLAAQYESWSLPLAVILVVPMCLLCSIVGVAVAHMDVNIFTQIGFVVLVGLACKNAILIVEYAKAQREGGADSYQAALAACHLRLRPIMMTSFAFILGVVPLVVAVGAGAEMRRTLGTAVFAGMLGVTLFGIFLTPVFFYVIQWFAERRAARH